ncbi:uncharacterized protein LOC110454616 isoform X2 [Mizuhopecten yessoensis]|uniref:uncharacterized protein LOC110454616 isoform X2 n=1 Tax=Mizuhopecten yessoensis TaxID=6573 RepID=UPI000B45D64F|nr:uncharacterized protein LOC110454616 isoform X2 [Mizuhopecten yessoensis]
MVSLWTMRYLLIVLLAEFAAVPQPACCPVLDKNDTSIDQHITSLEAEWKQKLQSFENSLLLSVERRSLALAGVLVAISMVMLLIGTCFVSCRSDEALAQYEPLSQEEWDNLSTSIINGDQVDFKNLLYSAAFRESPET